jgi:hypothetical protein
MGPPGPRRAIGAATTLIDVRLYARPDDQAGAPHWRSRDAGPDPPSVAVARRWREPSYLAVRCGVGWTSMTPRVRRTLLITATVCLALAAAAKLRLLDEVFTIVGLVLLAMWIAELAAGFLDMAGRFEVGPEASEEQRPELGADGSRPRTRHACYQRWRASQAGSRHHTQARRKPRLHSDTGH